MDELGGDLLGIALEAPHAEIQHLASDLAEAYGKTRQEAEGAEGLSLEQVSAPSGDAGAEEYVEAFIELRAAARRAKQWGVADAARDGLAGLGFELTDRPGATEWKWGGN